MMRSGSAYRLMLGLVLTALVAGAAPQQSGGVLRRHPTNGRYFTDNSGRAIYLTGSHCWDTFQKWLWGVDSTDYFNLLQANNHNFMRFWVADTGWSPYRSAPIEPQPYVRTGPGTAADGRPKFNLNQLNQAYFDQLRSVVMQARDRGIYVSVMLFNSWGISRYEGWAPHDTTWLYHPFRLTNNVNNINGDPNGDNKGYEYHTLQIPAIVQLQEAYVRKVIDTVNDLDNVVYEISNEDVGAASRDWQAYLTGVIRNYEAGKPKQHLVGITALVDPAPRNDWLFSSPADWVAPQASAWDSTSEPYAVDPPVADGGKVSLSDSDHLFYDNYANNPTLVRQWAWKSFLRGHNPILMEDLSTHSGWVAGRTAMGQSRSYADRIDLAGMTPQNGLSTTAYFLAKPGAEYLAYQPGSGSFSVYLQAGTYSIEWFNTVTGATSTSPNVSVGTAWRSFSPPSSEAVLYLKAASGGGGTNGASFVSQSVPTTMTAGGSYPVSVTLQNSGTSTWTAAANHRLGSQNPSDNTTWGMARVDLGSGESIAPGQQKTFSWTVTAPSTAGTYNFQWRMVQEFVQWFGATTPNVAVTVTAGGTPPPPSGLIGHWKFDEGSGTFAADGSGNGNHGTWVNGSAWTPGKSGSAASLDGVDDYVSVPASSSLDAPRTALTIAMWVYKRADAPEYAALAGRRWGPGYEDSWVLFYNYSGSDEYSFGVRTGSAVYVNGPSSVADRNTWVHLAGVYDGSRIRIYRNGVEVASAAQSGTIALDATPLFLGAGDNGNTGIREYVNAALDDVRLYSRALSAAEIQGLVGGSSTTYVSDLPWSYQVSGWGPIEKDRSNGEDAGGDGVPMRLNGVAYSKGIGCHSYSEIRVPLGGQYSSFQSDIGVDDEVDGAAGSWSTIVFQVWADGVKLYDSGVMTWTSATQSINVSVAGRQELRLIVTDAGDNNWYDHADWADARLTR